MVNITSIILGFNMANFYKNQFGKEHVWVTVINPINHRSLLQACDGCGVVKSENSIIRNCAAPTGSALISNVMAADGMRVF